MPADAWCRAKLEKAEAEVARLAAELALRDGENGAESYWAVRAEAEAIARDLTEQRDEARAQLRRQTKSVSNRVMDALATGGYSLLTKDNPAADSCPNCAELEAGECKQAPREAFTIHGYTFSRYPRSLRLPGRWECSAHGRGSSAHTPLVAWLRLRRFLKVKVRPM